MTRLRALHEIGQLAEIGMGDQLVEGDAGLVDQRLLLGRRRHGLGASDNQQQQDTRENPSSD
mgnify:CR=1 FL=1